MKVIPSWFGTMLPALLISASVQAQAVLPIGNGPVGPTPPVPTEPITIKKIIYNGSGCPLGSVAENISDDKQAFTLTFSEFVAEAGPGLPIASGRKNCIATVTLKVPSGWQYSVANFYYRGFVQIEEGMQADHAVNYSFEGQGQTSRFGTGKTGPFEGDYVYSDAVDLKANVWSPCGEDRALNLNANINVYNKNVAAFPNAHGIITNDTIDGQITQVWGITWRPCK